MYVVVGQWTNSNLWTIQLFNLVDSITFTSCAIIFVNTVVNNKNVSKKTWHFNYQANHGRPIIIKLNEFIESLFSCILFMKKPSDFIWKKNNYYRITQYHTSETPIGENDIYKNEKFTSLHVNQQIHDTVCIDVSMTNIV
jgi:hypothetical protein